MLCTRLYSHATSVARPSAADRPLLGGERGALRWRDPTTTAGTTDVQRTEGTDPAREDRRAWRGAGCGSARRGDVLCVHGRAIAVRKDRDRDRAVHRVAALRSRWAVPRPARRHDQGPPALPHRP